jgi:hypothetical protein
MGVTERQVATSAGYANRCLAWLPYVSLAGLAVLVANILLSFEEPHSSMLLVAAGLTGVAPLGMLLHLSTTSELTTEEKRRWVAGLRTRQAPMLFAAYFRAPDRHRATEGLTRAAESRG